MSKDAIERSLVCIRCTPHPNSSDPAFEHLAFQVADEDGILEEAGMTLAMTAHGDLGELGIVSQGKRYHLSITEEAVKVKANVVSSGRCEGITKAGKRCKKAAGEGGFCKAHAE